MNKNDNQQLSIQQLAIILNYNAHVEHQYNKFGSKPMEKEAESIKFEDEFESEKFSNIDFKNYSNPQSNADYMTIYKNEQADAEGSCDVATNDFQQWIEMDCYGKPTLEKLLGYRLLILMELFASRIFEMQVGRMITTEKRNGEIDFDKLDNEADRNRGWKNYTALRDLFDYQNGLLVMKNQQRIGRLFYHLRHDQNVDNKIRAFFLFRNKLSLVQKEIEEIKILNGDRVKMLSPKRKLILSNLEVFIGRGEWVKPATEDTIKQMIYNVLDVGENVLEGVEKEMSEALWHLLENREGDPTSVTWQNMVGYFHYYELLPTSKRSYQLQQMFYGNKDKEKYTNIDKGKPSSTQMPAKFKKVLPLLDTYRPVE